ncbi:MAG TPA: hypothetical protein DEP36_02595 [Gammaproteobacteria bacterium]|nr:hypothetical protein [Gammaproteobacteria bacterium]HRF45195.1 exonuclease domain-containing protein [Candidatus Competibacteraceae bacterium]
MKLRLIFALAFAVFALVTVAIILALLWLIFDEMAQRGELANPEVFDGWSYLTSYGASAGLLLIAITAAAWSFFDLLVALPLTSLTRGLLTALHANPEYQAQHEGPTQLNHLFRAANEILRRLAAHRQELLDAMAAATAQVEKQKHQLEAILMNLQEGVVVCNLNNQVLLYNQHTLKVLHISTDFGLGRSLLTVVTPEPIATAFRRLRLRVAEGRHHQHPMGATTRFVCATIDGRHTLHAQMTLILDDAGTPAGYVITLDDITEELTALGKRDRLLREATEGLRAPVANLCAAVEMQAANPDMDVTSRRSFDDVVFKESAALSETVNQLCRKYRDAITGHWPMTDGSSATLLELVALRFREAAEITVTVVDLPQWVRCDSHSVVLLLEYLIRCISDCTKIKTFDIGVEAGPRQIYIDIAWQGDPVLAALLDGWLNIILPGTPGNLTARDVLDHHQSEIWSDRRSNGLARLRVPMIRGQIVQTESELPPRPEFYDFSLLQQPTSSSHIAERPLKSLDYVVFDLETTGLKPSEGDEIVSIAGVRIVNGRILTGEIFDRLVNPGRLIPKTSTRFHGITDEMVQSKPPIHLVLPQFHQFVGDAVLIAHDAAFDLKFIQMKEADSGIHFDNPVLDTLLLSVFLHDHTPAHHLDAIADRFGVQTSARHTALGDALVTAGIFMRMLELLEEMNVTTLSQAIAVSSKMIEAKERQRQL